MGGFEEDPVFGSASRMMRQMDTMMSSMMHQDPFGGDPFGSMMGTPMIVMSPMMQPIRQPPQRQLAVMGHNNMNALNLMANPMTMMNSMLSNMDHIRGESTSQVFSSSSVMSMTTGPDGRPQLYQESTTSRGGPGGVRETQHSVVDSSKGLRKMAIGHHIGDRARIVERERNHEGEEEREELLNLDDEEADEFEQEFRRVSGRPSHNSAAGGRSRALASSGHSSGGAGAPLAIENRPATVPGRTDRHDGRADRHDQPTTAAASDRYGIERISLNRPSGIEVSHFDRRSADRSGVDRLEYHRPNVSYVPAPTSFVRPSSYTPSTSYSSRPFRVSSIRRPVSSYTAGRSYRY